MRKLYFCLILLLSFFFQIVTAQQPQKPNAVEIYNQIQKLNFLGSVLYIAAHPDDENTRLLSYLSNEKMARTGYLSLTRGDGGQNLIGPELRELLGVIRTQELIEARKIDGGEQFFSRANDFGFSKNPDETLAIWDKDAVLSDVVYIIRKFQPDVIINRFDARSPGTTHGHHTSSALLSLEAFDIVNSPGSYPEQLKLVATWQPKRVFFNTSWWFYGSKEKFEKADKSNLIQLNTGVYYPSIGKSNQEIAALSRSRHQSQGFGSTGTRGEDQEYLEFLKGSSLQNQSNLFDGIDTSWNRVPNGKPIGDLLTEILKKYDFKNPSASIPDLVKAYSLVEALQEDHWKPIKLEEIKKVIAACSGLYLEAIADAQEVTNGSTLKVTLEAINRSALSMRWNSIATFPESSSTFQSVSLANNVVQYSDVSLIIKDLNYTQPYWLKDKGTVGMYRVEDQNNIGVPDIIREAKVTFNITINNVMIPFQRMIAFKYNDDVKGEVYKPLDIVPKVTTSIQDKVLIFNGNQSKNIAVKIQAGQDTVSGVLKLITDDNWKVTPQSIPFSLTKKGAEQTVFFQITAPKKAGESIVKSIAIVDSVSYDKEPFTINYEHISKQQVLKPSEAKLIQLTIKTGQEKIAYIMGAGDEVPKSLRQMGYAVTLLKPEEITVENLKFFNVVITGIRAYNTVQALAFKQTILFDFVKEGHNMIVQYNTMDDFVTPNFAPYPLKISKDRVTDENAAVTFLEPNHPILNQPNTITPKDFEGWKQEQGLYYPNEWDKAFTPVLASNDKGETPKKGALLVAKLGKGNYIYTGLSFFRELPEGVSGAYRLMANLISLPH